MPRERNCALLPVLLLLAGTAGADSICQPDGLQQSGSIYRICMPAAGEYNGNLVLWAHGFQDAGTPVSIPEDQLDLGAVSLPEIINGFGFGFATNSYSKTGLAIRQGMDDLLDLVQIYSDTIGPPERVFLTGASEGGIITTLLLEQHPEVFDAGVAACGPIGDFPAQIDYFGDGRALFEVFFPGVIPGDPFDPPQTLVDGWRDYYEAVVEPAVREPANADRLRQYAAAARLPFDVADYLDTVEESIEDVLRYSVVNLGDAAETLGGFPYDNRRRYYTGSDNDRLLNLLVPRASVDPAALAEMRAFYDTSGELSRPLVTIHTTLDQQVPYWHQPLYILKTLRSGAWRQQHFAFRFDRYGHCNFTVPEVLFSFALMVQLGNAGSLGGVAAVLDEPALARFDALAREHGLHYRPEGERPRLLLPEGATARR